VGGQQLCQIFAAALLAAQWFLFLQNKKLIRLTALPATVLKNRHDYLLYVTDSNTLRAYIAISSFLKLILVPAFSLMSSACIVYR
jgi:hypothetical protein